MSRTDSKPTAATAAPIRLRRPRADDGALVWRMARDSGALDANSPYAYLMWCEHFSATSVVAEIDARPAGFVCGFRPPERPDTLFVWQVAVDPGHRGRGLAARMLDELLEANPAVSWVEATVTPSNVPSRKLFQGLATRRETECRTGTGFRADQFPDGHEAETLFRIGPIAR